MPGYHPKSFPFIICDNQDASKVFLVNTLSSARTPLIKIKKNHRFDGIIDLKVTYRLKESSEDKQFFEVGDLSHIDVHFKRDK